MKIPYPIQVLMVIFLCLGKELENKKTEVKKIFDEYIPDDDDERNTLVAKYYKRPLEELMHDPKYQDLYDAYAWEMLNRIVGRFKTELFFADDEAWSIVAASMGLLF